MSFPEIVLLLNALWFVAAFVQFSIAQKNTLKILLPYTQRDNVIAPTLAAAVAFLGGMNLPIGLLSAWLLITSPEWMSVGDAAPTLFLFFAACHFSQFIYNVPILLRGGRVGEAWWPILKGPMLKIFVIDATLAVANVVVVVLGI
jgi:hypothetical protein